MNFSTPGFWICLLPSLLNGLNAAVSVNAPLSTTNRVIVNSICTVKTDGTKAAAWGNDKTVEFYIKGEIDRILNQSGIDVQFTALEEYVNDFAYDGTPGDYSSAVRPKSDLNTIVFATGAPGFTDVEVINLYFVEIVPGFSERNDNTVNGLAFIDGNGIAMHVGKNLLDFTAGRDAIAGVLAHEIGHNLGLGHTANGIANLMSPGGSSDQITPAQTTTIFTNDAFVDGADFAKPLADTTFAGWAIDNSVGAFEDVDDDADGVPALLEFALGMDPGRNDASRVASAVFSSGPQLELGFNKQESALDDSVVYSFEVAGTLGSWSAAGAAGTDSTLTVDTPEWIQAHIFGDTNAFMRLAVSTPASLSAPDSMGIGAGLEEVRMVNPDPEIYPCLIEKTVYPAEGSE